MAAHEVLSAIACAGHLAFALLVWVQRHRSSVARVLALLFLDIFIWNFADLAYTIVGASSWHWIDHAFSSLTPALLFHVVLRFVGRERALRWVLVPVYSSALVMVLLLTQPFWWQLLLAQAAVCSLLALALLVEHRATTRDRAERRRVDLIGLAVVIGTVLGTTDLWNEQAGWTVPRLSSVGTLLAAGVLAVAVLRLRLLDAEVPGLLPLYALLLGTVSVGLYLGAVLWLSPRAALAACALVTAGWMVFAVVRELGRRALIHRERTLRQASLGRLAEQLAHDLKNPLAALKGALQFLDAERAAGRSLDGHADFLKLMLEQTERIDRSVSQYQRLAKVEPLFVKGSLNDVVRSVLALERFAAAPGIRLQCELDERMPSCEFDPDLVAGALENILRNACEALPAGGTVVVRTEHREDDGALVLSVHDDGEGMDVRALERVTDEFFTTKARGSGLGLNFASRVARAHRGELMLTSDIGRGTTVRLCFPFEPLVSV